MKKAKRLYIKIKADILKEVKPLYEVRRNFKNFSFCLRIGTRKKNREILSINFKTAQGANNILDEALKNNADLPFACKGGVCCTCKAKLIEGQVDMQVNYGLEDDEIADGYILTCQALPISDKVVVDFDEKG